MVVPLVPVNVLNGSLDSMFYFHDAVHHVCQNTELPPTVRTWIRPLPSGRTSILDQSVSATLFLFPADPQAVILSTPSQPPSRHKDYPYHLAVTSGARVASLWEEARFAGTQRLRIACPDPSSIFIFPCTMRGLR